MGPIQQAEWGQSVLGVETGGWETEESGIWSFGDQAKASHPVSFLTLPLVNTGLGCQAAEHSE